MWRNGDYGSSEKMKYPQSKPCNLICGSRCNILYRLVWWQPPKECYAKFRLRFSNRLPYLALYLPKMVITALQGRKKKPNSAQKSWNFGVTLEFRQHFCPCVMCYVATIQVGTVSTPKHYNLHASSGFQSSIDCGNLNLSSLLSKARLIGPQVV
jgi:hypothetical protein